MRPPLHKAVITVGSAAAAMQHCVVLSAPSLSALSPPPPPHRVSHPYLTSFNTLQQLYFAYLRGMRGRGDSNINHNWSLLWFFMQKGVFYIFMCVCLSVKPVEISQVKICVQALNWFYCLKANALFSSSVFFFSLA